MKPLRFLPLALLLLLPGRAAWSDAFSSPPPPCTTDCTFSGILTTQNRLRVDNTGTTTRNFQLNSANASVAYPVPTFQPISGSQTLAFDLFPSASGTVVETANGFTWSDFCDANGAGFHCVRVGMKSTGYIFGGHAFGSATANIPTILMVDDLEGLRVQPTTGHVSVNTSIDGSQLYVAGSVTAASGLPSSAIASLVTTTTVTKDAGGVLGLGGYTDTVPTIRNFAMVKGGKEVFTQGDTSGYAALYANRTSVGMREGFRLTSSLHVEHRGPTSTLGSGASDCGTSPVLASGSNDSAGRVTVGTSTNGGVCTLTFATSDWTNAPVCAVRNETSGVALRPAPTTSALQMLGTLVAGDTLSYACEGFSS